MEAKLSQTTQILKMLWRTYLGVLPGLGQLLSPGQGQHLDQLPDSHTHTSHQLAANVAKLTEMLGLL